MSNKKTAFSSIIRKSIIRSMRLAATTISATMFYFCNQVQQLSRAWHSLHVFPRLELLTYFPALGTGYMFSRAWYWLHVSPRLVLVTCFPALGNGYMFSRAGHSLHVFALSSDCLVLFTSFTVTVIDYVVIWVLIFTTVITKPLYRFIDVVQKLLTNLAS